MEIIRELIVFENYFYDFYDDLSKKIKEKIDYIFYVLSVSEKIPAKFFKHIEGTSGLFEVRIEFESNIYRIFCCFDEGKLVVLFNGFQKKTQKTLQKEIDKALEIMKLYFKSKQDGNEK